MADSPAPGVVVWALPHNSAVWIEAWIERSEGVRWMSKYGPIDAPEKWHHKFNDKTRRYEP